MPEVPDRPSIDAGRLREHVLRTGGLWHTIRYLEQTYSTNDVATTAALAGESEGLVVLAEFQTAGRGRHERAWVSPPRAGLTFSVLLRPGEVPIERWGWVPLLVGTAVATAISEAGQVAARLKWPNDVLLGAGQRKAAGVLSAVAGQAIVVGVGLNVTTAADELPSPQATSLHLEGAWTVDRTALLGRILDEVERDYRLWRSLAGDPEGAGLLERYRRTCATLGSEVTVGLPGGGAIVGLAADVTPGGALLVDGPNGRVTVAAGDVVHVRGTEHPRGIPT